MTENKVTVVMQTKPGLVGKFYNIGHRISDKHFERFCFPLAPGYYLDQADLGPTASKIVNHLKTVDGITEIHIRPYELYVEKGVAYKWVDIEPDIFYALEKSLGKPLDIKEQ